MSKSKRERRINGEKASKDLFFQLFQYLFYEPKYRKLSNDARVLYALLRDRYKLSVQTSKNEDTYIDKDGYIYCIADNTELSYMLMVSEPTAIKAKKELHSVELLDEEPVKDGSNRLYVLEPELTTDNWMYKSEIEELREKKKAKKAAERKRRKEKKVAEKAQKEAAKTQQSVGDLKNLSHQENSGSSENGDLNNFSHVTKESLAYTKVFNIQTDFTYFSKYVGRSIPELIVDFFKEYFKTTKYAKIELTNLCEQQNTLLVFEAIKRAIDGEPDKPIAYIKGTVAKWTAAKCETLEDIYTYEKDHREKKQREQQPKRKKTSVRRKEMVPDWKKQQDEQGEQTPKKEKMDETRLESFKQHVLAISQKNNRIINLDEITLDNYTEMGTYTNFGFEFDEITEIFNTAGL
ncbi:replication initiator protein A [Bacillus manliponensis]|uniref:replication initiator protein A n=1 Tax=Bacillus manliponensis TaxID=574376 RepID=UPI000A004246|nr:replication initiator protein A [Bacillus manliponensis]